MFEQLGSFTKGFDFIFSETIYFCSSDWSTMTAREAGSSRT
jgi:hypothetical protein